MNRLLQFTLSAFFLLLFSSLSAQYSLSGAVVNAESKPVADANIYLLRKADSTVVKTALTEENGKFEFRNLKSDTLFVIVKHLEHQTFGSETITLNEKQTSFDLRKLALAARKDTELETVSIVAKLPLIERKIDRTVVNVDAMITVAGGSALDALEKSPGVFVDQNGNIQLKGQGVMVLIDDKPTYMSGTDLENYLRSIPASTLKQIELMTNPPAKYDAAGNGGVINIKTKKNNIQGFNGSLTLNYGQGRYGKSYNSLNINYRRNKFNLFTNLSGGGRETFQDLYIDRIYLEEDESPQSYFGQRSYIKRKTRFGNAKVGMDYYVSDKTTVGLVLSGSASPSDNHTANIAEVQNAVQALTSSVVADNSQKVNFRNASVNFNVRHEFDSTGRSLTFDADALKYASDEDHLFKNFVYTPTNFLTYEDQLDGALGSDIQILSLKTDYSHPLKNGLTLGTWLKTIFTKTDNAV